ncbi:MAG: hypothetical protein JNM56_31345 [Planctomycetia bacterium]|nr:hypothetical protein [Planctomycetia bacterium]
MGIGWHVVLETELPGAALAPMDGRALIHRQHDLDALAALLGVPPLTQFVSSDPAAIDRYLREQGLDPEDFPLPEVEWFAAEDGLPTVRGLLAHLKAKPDAVLDAYRIVQDLRAMEAILGTAAAVGLRFHLQSDMPKLNE